MGEEGGSVACGGRERGENEMKTKKDRIYSELEKHRRIKRNEENSG